MTNQHQWPIREQYHWYHGLILVVGNPTWLIWVWLHNPLVAYCHRSTSSTSPSQAVLPTRRYKFRVWRSKIRSVSNFSNLDTRSLIKLAFSSVSFLQCSLSSFKSSRRNSINTSFDADILFQTGLIKHWLAFYRFSLPLVTIYKPPINGFLFHFHNSSQIFYFPQAWFLTYVTEIVL